MRRRIFILIGILSVIGIGGYFLILANSDRILAWQVERGVAANLEAQKVDEDRFEVMFCGTGSPQYNPDRGQSCLAILAAGKLFLFDAGQGAAQGLQSVKAPVLKLDSIYFTHFHSDHMSGLGDVLHNSWLFGRKTEVDVVGPPGTEETLAGVQQAFAQDLHERNNILGDEYRDRAGAMGNARNVEVQGKQLLPVYDKDGVTISAFRVDHPKWEHAYGYKIEYRGKSIVVSGDTRYSPNLVAHSKDMDMLIHEALNVKMMKTIAKTLRGSGSDTVDPDRMELITNTHTATHELAKIATEANVKKLIVTHLIPPIPANRLVEDIFIDGMSDLYTGEIIVARDDMRLILAE